MCFLCQRTQGGSDYLGLGAMLDNASNMVVIGGLTALVAIFAVHYFNSGVVGSYALNTAAVIGGVTAVLGVCVFVASAAMINVT